MSLLVSQLQFAATTTAPVSARMFVRWTLNSWLLAGLVEDAELVVSELVTNAVEATGTTQRHPTYTDLDDLPLVGVQLRLSGDALLIEVWDRDGATALIRDGQPRVPSLHERGRGLLIVAALSRRHGVTLVSTGGKVIWAELDADREVAAGARMRAAELPAGAQPIALDPQRPAAPAVRGSATAKPVPRQRHRPPEEPRRRPVPQVTFSAR